MLDKGLTVYKQLVKTVEAIATVTKVVPTKLRVKMFPFQPKERLNHLPRTGIRPVLGLGLCNLTSPEVYV